MSDLSPAPKTTSSPLLDALDAARDPAEFALFLSQPPVQTFIHVLRVTGKAVCIAIYQSGQSSSYKLPIAPPIHSPMDNYSSFPHHPRSVQDQIQSSSQSYPYQGPSFQAYTAVPRAVAGPSQVSSLAQTQSLPHHQHQLDLATALPSEYDLISQSPEERAVLLEALKERRRLKELELRILEERRKEREAAMNATSPVEARRDSQNAQSVWTGGGMAPGIGRIALSALGANSSQGGSPDFGRPQTAYAGQDHASQQFMPPSRSPQAAVAGNSYYEQGSAAAPAIRHSLSPPSSSTFGNFDAPLPTGLGLSSASLSVPNAGLVQQPHDPYVGYSNQPQQQQRPNVTGSPDSLLNASPSPSGQTATVAPGLMWDSAIDAMPSSIPGMSINTNVQVSRNPPTASNFSAVSHSSTSTSVPSSLVPTPPQHFLGTDGDLYSAQVQGDVKAAPYAISNPGSDHGDSSPPNHLYPTPPPQVMQYSSHSAPLMSDGSYQHPSMQVKHPRLSDSSPVTAGSSYSQLGNQAFGSAQPFPPAPGVPSTSAQANAAAAAAAASARKTKKVLIERVVICQSCNHPMCKLLLRGTAEELATPYDPYYECVKCVPQSSAAASQAPSSNSVITIQAGYGSGGGGFTGSGLRLTRKRTRQTEDTTMPTVCDVCIRTIGRGGLVPHTRSAPLAFAVEVVCSSCSAKYSRCSDCGGGSGRVGVGKWRAKELFENGRKTCKLPHVRVGGGELELSVWEVPWEIQNRKEFGTLMAAVKTMWSERVLARLAIPEVLEGGEDDWPPGSGSGQNTPMRVERTFADVEDVVAKGWPGKPHG